ncbi:X-ray repair cross-complementing protein 6 [Umbelopsis sp. WA50703]
MSASWNADREEEDDFSEETKAEDYTNHDSILFVIDASPAMLEPQDNGEMPLQSAFRAVRSVLLSKAFGSASDSVGVLLYGTRLKQNDAGHEHIYLLQNLDSPDAPRIKEIENIAENIGNFEEEYGSVSEEFPLGNVFWTASNIFSVSSKKKGTRRIFFLTNEENPHSANIGLRNAAIRRAKDLWEAIIESDEAMKTTENDTTFQQTLEQPRSSGRLKELLQKIRRKEIKKRSEFRVPFHLNDELTIGVVGYALVREQTRSAFQKVVVTGEQIKEVESIVTWKCVDTDQLLLPTDIKYYYVIGSEPIVFTKDELAEVRTFGEPGIRLLGFLDQKHVLPHWNITHSYFIYPNEYEYSGSTRTFTALLRSTVKKQKAILCSFIRRTNALPKLAILLPQEEVLDNQHEQVRPPGFHVIVMPYADDIRPVPPVQGHEANDEQIDAAKAFVERLSIKGRFDPLVYENPVLQRHYAGLQAAALEHPMEDVVDKTIPRYEAIHKRIGKDIQAFNDIIGREFDQAQSAPPEAAKSHRRPAAADKSSQYEVEELYKQGELKKCTVAILRQWLISRGVAAKNRKADLIEQVESCLAKS